jgi:AmiR/NasT family two-component response regulator
MRTREVIGQAAGLLMQKYGLDPDEAIGFLVRSSSQSNIKLRDIARQC